MLNFDDEVVEFKLKGVQHKLAVPNNKQIDVYRSAVAKCDDAESKVERLKEFLFDLGLTKDAYDSMTQGQLTKLVTALYGTEKN